MDEEKNPRHCLGCPIYDMNDVRHCFGTCEIQGEDFHATHICNLPASERKPIRHC